MGRAELIEALRREAEEKARKIWGDAEEEAGRVRERGDARVQELRKAYEAKRSAVLDDEGERIVSDARDKARAVRLEAQGEILERLRSVAFSSLSELRGRGYGETFGLLAEELPPCKWLRVEVNPEDRELARRCFPGAEVREDSAITGGMTVLTEDGEVAVINTFEKRLEKSWEEIASLLMEEAREEALGSAART